MKKLSVAALIGALSLAGCSNLDPTRKHDFHCAGTFEALSACTLFHITDTEALAAGPICGSKDGSWGSGGCPAELSGQAQIAGACVVSGSDYTLSGTDVDVYFYEPVTAGVAETACTGNGGTWHP